MSLNVRPSLLLRVSEEKEKEIGTLYVYSPIHHDKVFPGIVVVISVVTRLTYVIKLIIRGSEKLYTFH